MPKIQDRFDFKPSSETLEKWRSTRKIPFKVGVTELPGYFQTAGYSTDKVWVWLVIGIELMAILTTIAGGYSKGGGFFLMSIFAAILFVFLDYFGARWHHSTKGVNCRIKNEMRVEEDAGSFKGLKYELEKKKIVPMLGTVLIVICALLKVVAIFAFLAFGMTFTVIFTLLYLIAIYIHLKHTGYVLAERTVITLIHKNHREWAGNRRSESSKVVNSTEKTSEKNGSKDLSKHVRVEKWPFTTMKKLTLNSQESENDGHYISFVDENMDSDETTIYNYNINTRGVMLDKDIGVLADGQTTEMQKIIALECLKKQLNY